MAQKGRAINYRQQINESPQTECIYATTIPYNTIIAIIDLVKRAD